MTFKPEKKNWRNTYLHQNDKERETIQIREMVFADSSAAEDTNTGI